LLKFRVGEKRKKKTQTTSEKEGAKKTKTGGQKELEGKF